MHSVTIHRLLSFVTFFVTLFLNKTLNDLKNIEIIEYKKRQTIIVCQILEYYFLKFL